MKIVETKNIKYKLSRLDVIQYLIKLFRKKTNQEKRVQKMRNQINSLGRLFGFIGGFTGGVYASQRLQELVFIVAKLGDVPTMKLLIETKAKRFKSEIFDDIARELINTIKNDGNIMLNRNRWKNERYYMCKDNIKPIDVSGSLEMSEFIKQYMDKYDSYIKYKMG